MDCNRHVIQLQSWCLLNVDMCARVGIGVCLVIGVCVGVGIVTGIVIIGVLLVSVLAFIQAILVALVFVFVAV